MQIGSQIFNIYFLGANRQFDWLEIPLVYDKSNKHTTTYDSYNVEKAARLNKSVELESISEAYSEKYDMPNETQKRQTVAQ